MKNTIITTIKGYLKKVETLSKADYNISSKVGLSRLLEEIEKQRNPKLFKEAILKSAQLYYDGLIENPAPSGVWISQLETLDAIIDCTRETVGSFYEDHKKIPFDKIYERIAPHKSRLIKYGSRHACKYRHLAAYGRQIVDFSKDLSNALKWEKIDLIIPIASGGFEPAAFMADSLEVDEIFPVRYSSVSRKDKEVLIPAQAPLNYSENRISGNRVLIVDDLIEKGTTANNVIDWTKKYNPAQIYFTSVTGRKDLNHLNLCQRKDSEYLYDCEK